jgi:cytochrome c-type protein NapC
MKMTKKSRIKSVWQYLRSPSSAALWFILVIGFAGGVIFFGGFNTAGKYLLSVPPNCI